jgi:N-methylhydantoinase A
MVRPWAETDRRELVAALADLRERGDERLAAAEVPAERRSFERYAALRYRGQSYDLDVPLSDLDPEAVATRFHERHRERYGYADPEEPIELVTLRVRARGEVDPPALAGADPEGSLAEARRETRDVGFPDGTRETAVYDRVTLPAGADFEGPAIVEGAESTALVRPADSARVDGDGNLVVEVA